MDETIYQCPECNFNADKLTDLDSHINENHSKTLNQFASDDNYHNEYENGVDEENGKPNGIAHHQYNDHEDEDEDDMNDDDEDLYYSANMMANKNANYRIDAANMNGHANGESAVEEDDEEDFFMENENNNDNYDDEPEPNMYMNNNSNNHHPYQNNQHLTSHNSNNQKPKFNQPIANNRDVSSLIKTSSFGMNNEGNVINSDNHYERQYACKRCDFFTNNPRAVLYHRKEFHMEKINVHECLYCQYASQYSGKVERHTMLRHKISKKMSEQQNENNHFNSDNLLGNNSLTRTRSQNQLLNNSQSLNTSSHANQYGSFNTQQSNTRFQCDKCPCKYKRSSDLSKHLKQKHSIYTKNIHEYLRRVAREQQEHQQNNEQSINEFNDYNDDINENEDLDKGGNQSFNNSNNNNNSSFNSNNRHLNQQTRTLLANRNFNQIQRRSIINGSASDSPAAAQTNDGSSQPTIQAKKPSSDSLECPYCTYQSNGNDSEYLNHVKDHLCGKTFRCVLCNSVYKYRGDCVVHLKRKHQKADMIAHSYVDRFNLDNLEISQICSFLKPKQHEDLENEDKLFGCSYCDYKANYKGDVFKHQTRRHPGTPKCVNTLGNVSHLNMSANSNGYMNGHINGSNNSSANNSFHNNGMNNMNGIKSVNNGNRLNENGEEFGRSFNHQNGNENEFFEDEDEDEHNGNNENGNHEMYNEDGDLIEDDDEDLFNERGNNSNNNDDFSQTETTGGEENENHEYSNEHQHLQNGQNHRFQCKFCSFIGKNHAKLQLHLATHYNLKPFMCPVCKRRANFKWDIQKHLRKIHNDYQSEVICLSENEARKSINSYIEHKHFNNNGVNGSIPTVASLANASTTNSIVYENSLEKIIPNSNANSSMKENRTITGSISHPQFPTFKFQTRHRPLTRHAFRERKFKCSLCMRTSKWQWDIKKHLRTVHKNREGDVIVLKEREITNMNNSSHHYHHNHNSSLVAQNQSNSSIQKPNLNNSLPSTFNQNNLSKVLSSGLFRNNIINSNHQQLQSNNAANLLNSVIGSDVTGNKKFKCTRCVYRSNWKADLFRHIRKRHHVTQPRQEDVIVLSTEEAQRTLFEYERLHGINIRKRNRLDINNTDLTSSGVLNDNTKRFKTDISSIASSATTLSTMHSSRNGENNYNNNMNYEDEDDSYFDQPNNNVSQDYEAFDQQDETLENDNDFPSDAIDQNVIKNLVRPEEDTKSQDEDETNIESSYNNGGVERLPVSVAELNIKPYKCLKCGFRSDRKSDTLRHIRVKHSTTAMQAFKFLRILSIKEASETINQYEMFRSSRKTSRGSKEVEPASTLNSLINARLNNLTDMNINPKMLNNQINAQIPQQGLRNIIPVNNRTSQSVKVPTNGFLNINNSNLNNHQKQSPSITQVVGQKKQSDMPMQQENHSQLIDYYKCPFCPFKHLNKMVMRRHLVVHFRGYTNSECTNALSYKCNVCPFKSQWQFTVKKHIIMCHSTTPNAQPVKLVSAKLKLFANANNEKQFRNNRINSNDTNNSKNNFNNPPTKQPIANQQSTSQAAAQSGAAAASTLATASSNPYHQNSNIYDDQGDEQNNDEEFFNYEDDANEDDYNHTSNSEMNGTNHYSFNSSQYHDDDCEKKVESTIINDYDGNKCTVTYLVSASSAGSNSTLALNNSNSNNNIFKKKMYYCQTCPYKTSNYCNLKQHLLQHKPKEGYFKCRYCAYYVSLLRLLKQHEVLHPGYEPRELARKKPASNLNGVHNHLNNITSFNGMVKANNIMASPSAYGFPNNVAAVNNIKRERV